VIGLQAYALHFMIIFVLICTVGINAVREVMVDVMWMVFCPKTFVYIEVWRRDMKMSLLWWRSILTLPWRRRLSPVATRRRLVSAEYFGCTLI